MYEDEPQDKVHDVLATAIFGDHPLGRPVIGRAEVIGSVPVPDIAAYHDERYPAVEHRARGRRAAWSTTGSWPWSRARWTALGRRGRRARARAGAGRASSPRPALPRQGHRAVPPLPRRPRALRAADERRFALRMLDTILGGSTSSRLFQEVREKRGLAYAVYSYSSQFVDSGHVGLYVGTRPDNVIEAMDVIGTELRRIAADGVTEEELERARENVKGRTTLAMESTLARMNRLGSSLLMGVPLLSLDELLAATDAVTLEDVKALAAELFDPARMSAAGVGEDEDRFRDGPRAGEPGAARRRDPGRRLRRRGAHGGDRVPGRGGRRRHGADRARGSRARTPPLADILGDAEVVVDFSQPDTALGERARLPGGRRALRDGHHRRRLLRAGGRGQRQPVRGPELRHRRGADDGGLQADRRRTCPSARSWSCTTTRSSTRPSGTAARTAELIGEAGGNVHEPIHSVRLPGPGGPPGGALRRRGADAVDPPRLDLARVLHARRAARREAGRDAGELADGRARGAAVQSEA